MEDIEDFRKTIQKEIYAEKKWNDHKKLHSTPKTSNEWFIHNQSHFKLSKVEANKKYYSVRRCKCKFG
jgi:hypothetical protein